MLDLDPRELLRKLRVRVDAMVARAVIDRVNDALRTQRLQLSILADEVEDGVEHLQPYGLSFVPPAGAECIALAPGGYRSGTVAICAQLPGDRPTGGKPRTGGLYTKGAWRLFIDDAGIVCLGAETSAEHLVLGDTLVKLLGQLTVPTAMGPSGTPLNAAAFQQALSRHTVSK